MKKLVTYLPKEKLVDNLDKNILYLVNTKKEKKELLLNNPKLKHLVKTYKEIFNKQQLYGLHIDGILIHDTETFSETVIKYLLCDFMAI